jgi:putative FmdB family regulatory protein
MATYQYRCDQDGLVETAWPIGTAPPRLACPACGDDARRVFTTPLLALADRRVMSLIDKTESTSAVPDVVTSLPPRRRRPAGPPAPTSPALHRLPRP